MNSSVEIEVSIITYVYADQTNDRIPLLVDCLESVESQKLNKYEHLIIDDGSPIDLTSVISRFPNTRMVKKAGSGILSSSHTFNLGHELAKGKYCIYLPSDDAHCEGAVEALVAALKKNDDALWAIGRAIYEYSEKPDIVWVPDMQKITEQMHLGNHVNGCAVMWRKSEKLLADMPPNFTGFCSDYDLWCTLVAMGDPILIDDNIVRYRHAKDSTRNKTRSRLITSPRKADSQYYQYSKASRIEMVKDRIVRLQRDLEYFKLEVPSCEEAGNFSAIKSKFVDRKWNICHEYLLKKSKSYLATYFLIEETFRENEKLNLVIECTGWQSIVLMQHYKYRVSFICKTDLPFDAWHFDFLPMPSILEVVALDGSKRPQLESFLGVRPNDI